jgi:hypothetical protein
MLRGSLTLPIPSRQATLYNPRPRAPEGREAQALDARVAELVDAADSDQTT